MTPLLDARGVTLERRLSPTDLRVPPGRMVALVGPNGGGKTSLLRALGGIERTGGEVTVAEEVLSEAPPVRRARLISFLPASRDVVWPISVRDVIGLGLTAPNVRRVEELLDRFDLAQLAGRPINSLSTGERSRALLARALASEPRLLLLDEPLSNLDPYWVLRTLEILREETEGKGASALVALHDLNQLDAFDRVLLIDDGRVVLDDTPSGALASDALCKSFRVERVDGRWRISRRAEDPRSSR